MSSSFNNCRSNDINTNTNSVAKNNILSSTAATEFNKSIFQCVLLLSHMPQ